MLEVEEIAVHVEKEVSEVATKVERLESEISQKDEEIQKLEAKLLAEQPKKDLVDI